MYDLLSALLLGILEGLTEFLPISSTGHLLIAQHWLGPRSDFFNIIIQAGAIVAVVLVFRQRLWQLATGLGQRENRDYVFKLGAAFLVTAVVGLPVRMLGWELPETVSPVAWALIIGGIGILVVEKLAKTRDVGGISGVTTGQSVKIGLVQCIAMIPGVSRSGATIMGAMALGIDRRTAAEFSFFLALPTLTGATVLQMVKHRDEITANDLQLIGVGAFVSFIVALVVVKAFMAVVTKHGFAPFAWYRIVAGALALVLVNFR